MHFLEPTWHLKVEPLRKGDSYCKPSFLGAIAVSFREFQNMFFARIPPKTFCWKARQRSWKQQTLLRIENKVTMVTVKACVLFKAWIHVGEVMWSMLSIGGGFQIYVTLHIKHTCFVGFSCCASNLRCIPFVDLQIIPICWLIYVSSWYTYWFVDPGHQSSEILANTNAKCNIPKGLREDPGLPLSLEGLDELTWKFRSVGWSPQWRGGISNKDLFWGFVNEDSWKSSTKNLCKKWWASPKVLGFVFGLKSFMFRWSLLFWNYDIVLYKGTKHPQFFHHLTPGKGGV